MHRYGETKTELVSRRHGESREDYASLRRRNGSARARREHVRLQGYNGAFAHASRRREQGRLCIATARAAPDENAPGRRPAALQWRRCAATPPRAPSQSGSQHPRTPSPSPQCRLCITMAEQRQRQSMHRDCWSKTDSASLRQRNGSDISCIATARAAQTMQGYNLATARACVATARAGRTMHRYGEATVVTEHPSQRADYSSQRRSNGRERHASRHTAWASACSLPVAWRHGLGPTARAARRSNGNDKHMHRDGESRADYARIQRNNGPASACIATARAAQNINTTEQRQRQNTHRDGESSPDHASLRQSNGSDRRCVHRPTAGQTMPCFGGATARQSICIATARAGQTMQGYNGRDRGCIPTATAGQTMPPCTLRRSNGSDISCIATARAAQTMQGYNLATARACVATARAGRTMHRYGEATVVTEHPSQRADYSSQRRSNGRERHASRHTAWASACSLPVAWRHGLGPTARAARRSNGNDKHMHRDGESRADYARIQRNNGPASACIATARAAQNMNTTEHRQRQNTHRDGESRLCIAAAEQWQRQQVHRDQQQDRLCLATAEQRQRQSICIATSREGQTVQGYNGRDRVCIATATAVQTMHRNGEQQSMHRDGESRADYYTLRRNNGSDISCIGTARAAQIMQGYNGATAATEQGSRRPEQAGLFIVTAKQR